MKLNLANFYNLKLYPFLVVIFLLTSSLIFSQTKVESLKKELINSQSDSLSTQLYLDLGYEFEYIDADSAILFYNKALFLSQKTKIKTQEAKALMYIGIVYGDNGNYSKALEFYNQSLKINHELSILTDINLKKEGITGLSNCYGNIGNINREQGDYTSAINNYTKQLEYSLKIDNKKKVSTSYRSIGSVHLYQGNYNEAMAYFHKSLKIDDALGNKYGVARNYGNIGNVLSNQENYSQAIEYFNKQLEISIEIGDQRGISNCYGNIGNIHNTQGDFKNAIEYYKKALTIYTNGGDKSGMSYCYGNIGIAYNKLGNYKKAEEYSEKSILIKEELGDKNGITTSLTNLASHNISLADSTTSIKERRIYLNKAVKYAKRAMQIAIEIKALPSMNSASNSLQVAYTGLGDYKKALEYANIYISTKDSMFSEQKTKALTEMTARYEGEKKQLQIEKMEQQKLLDNKTIEAQQAENKKQLIIIISALFGLVVVLIFSVIMLRMFRQKKQANILLSTQKIEISVKNDELNQQAEELQILNENLHQQNEEITTQRDEIENQKSLIEDIYHNVEESINYATRLQYAILPDTKVLSKHLSDHFVLFKPKDKVSGDFYWWTHIDNHTVITAADSTGHGVPGAFMSMLGVSFLREIVQKEYITHPGVILRKMRKEIIKALKQKGEAGEQKDGMDMALITVNHENKTIQYAGANNPLYIITNKKLSNIENIEGLVDESSKYFYEIKPDKMPISIYERMDKFNTHEIQLETGDQIFMFSDGYADQFGGPKGKKFKYKPFKKLLLQNSIYPLEQQKENINKAFENWRGNTEQIDDIVIVSVII